MPFVTEALWKHLGKERLLMIEPWPTSMNRSDTRDKKEDFIEIIDIITAIRTLLSLIHI